MRASTAVLVLLGLGLLGACRESATVEEGARGGDAVTGGVTTASGEAVADDTRAGAPRAVEVAAGGPSPAAAIARLGDCEQSDCPAVDELVAGGEAVRPALMAVALDPGSGLAQRRGALEALARLQPTPEQRDLAEHARGLWERSKQLDDRALRHAHYRAIGSTRSDDRLLFEEVKEAFLAAGARRDEDEQHALQRALRAFPSHTVPFALHALEDPEAQTRLYGRLLGECASETDLPLLSDALARQTNPLAAIVLAGVMVQLGDAGQADRLCEELEAVESNDAALREQLLGRRIAAARALVDVARKLDGQRRARALKALEAGLGGGDGRLHDPYQEAVDRLRELDPTPAPEAAAPR